MSDVLETPCGGCGRMLRVPPEHAGKMARCPVCGHITQVPEGAVSVSPIAPASDQREHVGEAPAQSLSPSPALIAGVDEWYMKTPEEQTFGPASFQDLERWVKEGRITSDCQLCQSASGNWQPADWLFPSLKFQPTLGSPAGAVSPAGSYPAPAYSPRTFSAPVNYGPAARYTVPHRGPLILILGLTGLLVQCPIFPFMTWVMGSNDLREMQAGRMDPAGRDLTRAGMVIGMILSILWIVGFLFLFGLMLIGMVSG